MARQTIRVGNSIAVVIDATMKEISGIDSPNQPVTVKASKGKIVITKVKE